MTSGQTLSDQDRRSLADWAARCAERVVGIFDGNAESRATIHDALERARAYARGESTAHAEIRLRLLAGRGASAADSPAGAAAARAVGQAAAVAHMGAHALGAAGYALKALSLAGGDDSDDVRTEIQWQIDALSPSQRAALARLPRLGDDSAGPLGPGLLSRGVPGDTIRAIQAAVGYLGQQPRPR